MKDTGRAHRPLSCAGCHFAGKPFPPAKNVDTEIITARLKVKTLQALKPAKTLNSEPHRRGSDNRGHVLNQRTAS